MFFLRIEPKISNNNSYFIPRAFWQSIILPEFSIRKDIVGIGMSDWDGYSDLLAKKFSYTNTFYHKVPKFDITHMSDEMSNSIDFVISSDVFEHIVTPVGIGFRNMHKLIRGNGVCVFTVPFMHYPDTREHFSELHDFKVINTEDGSSVLRNTTSQGMEQIYNDVVFHGGEGATLEMRIFSRSALLREFKRTGFVDVKIHQINKPEFGIVVPINWSLPISARAKNN